jgi:galactitol-specific phosphotransferase system IIC component
MKIQRGKIAILLVVVVMIVPAVLMSATSLHERATNICGSTPTSEPDSLSHVEFSSSPLGWVCYKTFVDKLGHPLGKTLKRQLPLVP